MSERWLSIDWCPAHGIHAISITDADGGDIRLTPSQCCGHMERECSWKLDKSLGRAIVDEIECGLGDFARRETMSERNAKEAFDTLSRLDAANKRIAELEGLMAEFLALNPTVSGDMEKVRVFADVLRSMKEEASDE